MAAVGIRANNMIASESYCERIEDVVKMIAGIFGCHAVKFLLAVGIEMRLDADNAVLIVDAQCFC